MKSENLHELAREIADAIRAKRPHRILDIEHRGDAEARVDREPFAGALTIALGHALDASDAWMRTTGGSPSRVELEWNGESLSCAVAEPLVMTIGPGARDAHRATIEVPRSESDQDQ